MQTHSRIRRISRRSPGRRFLLALTAATAVAAGASAATLVDYQFGTNLTATTVAANVTAGTFGGLTGGAQQPVHSTGNGIAADGSTYAGSAPINNLADTGAAGGAGRVFARRFTDSGVGDNFQHYFSFSITVGVGYTLDIGNLTVDLGFRELSATAIKVEYSTNSTFSSGVVKIGEGSDYSTVAQSALGYSGSGNLGVTQATGSANISWNRFTNTDNLAGDEGLTGDVYFRIWARGGTGSTAQAQSNIFIDNVVVNGALTAIPEPSVALSVLAGFGLLALGRRRRP